MTTPTNTEELLAALKALHDAGRTAWHFQGQDTNAQQGFASALVRARQTIASAEQAHAAKDSPTPDFAANADLVRRFNEWSPRQSTLQDEGVRAALEPFAAIADHYADQEYDSFCVLSDFDILGPKLTLGMFRKARSVLATLSRGEAAEPTTCKPSLQVHHHEAGGAPGREAMIEAALRAMGIQAALDVHRAHNTQTWREACAIADAILALWAKPDRQGREEWKRLGAALVAHAGGNYCWPPTGGQHPHDDEYIALHGSDWHLPTIYAAMRPPSDQQGREQVIGELKEGDAVYLRATFVGHSSYWGKDGFRVHFEGTPETAWTAVPRAALANARSAAFHRAAEALAHRLAKEQKDG